MHNIALRHNAFVPTSGRARSMQDPMAFAVSFKMTILSFLHRTGLIWALLAWLHGRDSTRLVCFRILRISCTTRCWRSHLEPCSTQTRHLVLIRDSCTDSSYKINTYCGVQVIKSGTSNMTDATRTAENSETSIYCFTLCKDVLEPSLIVILGFSDLIVCRRYHLTQVVDCTHRQLSQAQIEFSHKRLQKGI
jgi:hypothetical protein